MGDEVPESRILEDDLVLTIVPELRVHPHLVHRVADAHVAGVAAVDLRDLGEVQLVLQVEQDVLLDLEGGGEEVRARRVPDGVGEAGPLLLEAVLLVFVILDLRDPVLLQRVDRRAAPDRGGSLELQLSGEVLVELVPLLELIVAGLLVGDLLQDPGVLLLLLLKFVLVEALAVGA